LRCSLATFARRARWSRSRNGGLPYRAVHYFNLRGRGRRFSNPAVPVGRLDSGNEQPAKGKKPSKAVAGQKETFAAHQGERAAKAETKTAEKPAAARTRKRA